MPGSSPSATITTFRIAPGNSMFLIMPPPQAAHVGVPVSLS
jgi:hypothetical protein